MRKFAALILILVSALGLSACGNANQSDTLATEANTPETQVEQAEIPLPTDNSNNTEVISEITTIQVIINGQEFEAELNDNEAAKQFTEMLPLQIDMEDLHDNEKYFYFSDDFDTEDQKLKEIHEGDLLIYDGKCLVLFYRKAFYPLICAECGKEFLSYGNRKRKYCSHACYIKARFQKGGCHDEGTV